MIMVQIMGGVGNQLFQYAAARRLSLKRDTELKFDISSFEDDLKRSFTLEYFNVKGSIASQREISCFKPKSNSMVSRIMAKASHYLPLKYKMVISSPNFGFDKKILNAGGNHYLKGYWAHENYFTDIGDVLMQEIVIKPEYQSEAFLQALESINSSESVSLHIRRGDYAQNSFNLSYFGVMPMEYYNKAVAHIKERVEKSHFFVFTDDVAWVKENLKLEEFTFIKDFGHLADYEELVLMSRCNHNIIANSTFSWWGAWLNPNSEKIILAPKAWYKNIHAQAQYEMNEFVPVGWIKL